MGDQKARTADAFRRRNLGCGALALAGALIACGTTPDPSAPGAGSGGGSTGSTGGATAGTAGHAGADGTSRGSGGAPPMNGGGSGNGGAGGTIAGGAGGADSGTGGVSDATGGADLASADGAAAWRDTGSAPAGASSCTLFVGPSPMMQWFRGGFLQQPGIDAGKFEMIWVAHHYTDAWAKPGDGAWNTALDNGHECASNAMAPDRVAFMATQWSHTTAAQWESDFSGIVTNIQKKWPGVKRIELMASTSAPGNKPCPAAGGKYNETIVPQIGYDAIDAMPAKFPGLVFALPHFEVPNCSDFIGNGTAPQYAPSATATTGPAVTDVAKMFAAYYVAHP
jgi:hypothetical protein